MNKEIYIELQDTQWPFESVNHDRNIARAIVYDENGMFYFVRAERDDDFGRATLIETSGGGVEPGEDLQTAIQRELKEELGVCVEVVCKIGVVSDYYNLIHRHNINNYFLCKVKSFGEKNMTQDEIESFHLSTLRLSYEEAVREYENRANTRLGTLVANRELPILYRAKEIIDETLDAVNNTTSVTNPYRARIALYSKYGIPISEMDKMWKKCDKVIFFILYAAFFTALASCDCKIYTEIAAWAKLFCPSPHFDVPKIEIFNVTNLSLNDIDLIVCDKGPGSFTGIRIGVASMIAFQDALKGLYVFGAKIVRPDEIYVMKTAM